MGLLSCLKIKIMSDHKKFENLNLDPSLTEDKMDTLKSG